MIFCLLLPRAKSKVSCLKTPVYFSLTQALSHFIIVEVGLHFLSSFFRFAAAEVSKLVRIQNKWRQIGFNKAYSQ